MGKPQRKTSFFVFLLCRALALIQLEHNQRTKPIMKTLALGHGSWRHRFQITRLFKCRASSNKRRAEFKCTLSACRSIYLKRRNIKKAVGCFFLPERPCPRPRALGNIPEHHYWVPVHVRFSSSFPRVYVCVMARSHSEQ